MWNKSYSLYLWDKVSGDSSFSIVRINKILAIKQTLRKIIMSKGKWLMDIEQCRIIGNTLTLIENILIAHSID